MEANYRGQVALLMDVLPEVAKEPVFALHGGTAINLFMRDMPRLSVDIDLTYIPIEDRESSLNGITDALEKTRKRVEAVVPGVKVVHAESSGKLLIARKGALVKLEVNLTNRGLLAPPLKMPLSEKVQTEFDVFCMMPVVPLGQLFGGKIVAALDRQHPRDLFDVKYLLDNEGFTNEVKTGFLLCLLSSARPTHELIRPNLLDHRQTLINQFAGMTAEPFTYEDFESTRIRLVQTIQDELSPGDKEFLLATINLENEWGGYDFQHFPSIQWKLQNLSQLKASNPKKHSDLLAALKSVLEF